MVYSILRKSIEYCSKGIAGLVCSLDTCKDKSSNGVERWCCRYAGNAGISIHSSIDIEIAKRRNTGQMLAASRDASEIRLDPKQTA